MDALGSILGASWSILGGLERLLGVSWALLRPLERLLAALGSIWDRFGGDFGWTFDLFGPS